MGLPAFFYATPVGDDTTVRVSCQREPIAGFVTKTGSGSAVMSFSVDAQGSSMRTLRGYEIEEYIVQVNDVSGGTEVGQAKFRWRRASDSTWQASGVTTSVSAVALSDGVSVWWTAGSGADFASKDEWRFRLVHPWGKGRLFSRDPNTKWRSGLAGATAAQSAYVSLDWGASQTFDAIILHDHNLTSAAVLTLKGYTGTDPEPFLDDFQIMKVRADGTSYDDKTRQGLNEDGANLGFSPQGASTFYDFIGRRAAFTTITVAGIAAAAVFTGSGAMQLVVQYWNGSAWTAVSNLTDGTASGGDTCQQDGTVTFDLPGDWAAGGSFPAGAANDDVPEFYYVRISVVPTVDKVVTTIDDAERTVPYAITAASFTETLTWETGTILHRTTGTRTARSVRLVIQDGGNTDVYHQIHEFFVGTETELSTAAPQEETRSHDPITSVRTLVSGADHEVLGNVTRPVSLRLRLSDADRNSLLEVHADCFDSVGARLKPFFFAQDRDGAGADLVLAVFAGPVRTLNDLGIGSAARWEVELELEEAVKGRS
ncbi:MAG: hypothetical protein HYZ11_08225 [Candidatus Tectomicrobia bacterium]|uniref:Uncharacterized protein n=1 Tax=Tectimicrobiota bacterium TaxID=2528274 RepID=A0A932MNB1_UNCTE|nr:hypothetical protein [Candidatus Tectomicrobia bacterium]